MHVIVVSNAEGVFPPFKVIGPFDEWIDASNATPNVAQAGYEDGFILPCTDPNKIPAFNRFD